MEQIAERLSGKLRTLTPAQLAQVETFIEALRAWERDRDLTRAAARLSEPAFAAVWDNPEDDAYDAI